MTVQPEIFVTFPEQISIGIRGFVSKLIASDGTSKFLGHRFEEGLVKQAIGQGLINYKGAMPSRIALFTSEPELDVISRSGLCATMASAFRGSLELRELTQPTLRDFLVAHATSSGEPVMVVLLGTEKRPTAWPLPDFSKLVPAPSPSKVVSVRKSQGHTFGHAGEWLRFDRRGACSVIDFKMVESFGDTPRANAAVAFEYSWGVWASILPVVHSPVGRLKVETLKLASKMAGQLVLSTSAKEKISQFLNQSGLEASGIIVGSFPTPEAGRWFFQAAGISPLVVDRVEFCEELHGWGPAFSLLRFSTDYPAGSRMLVMRDLGSIDLVVVE